MNLEPRDTFKPSLQESVNVDDTFKIKVLKMNKMKMSPARIAVELFNSRLPEESFMKTAKFKNLVAKVQEVLATQPNKRKQRKSK